MRAVHGLRIASLMLITGGIIALLLATFRGEADFGLFLIFPVIWGTGVLSALGIFMIFTGIFLFFISLFFLVSPPATEYGTYDSDITPERKSHAGGVILIGPIPVVFGSDWETAKVVVILAIILVFLLLILSLVL